MLSREYLREHPDEYRNALKNRGAGIDLERFSQLDEQRRAAIRDVEQKKAHRNSISDVLAGYKREKQDASAYIVAIKKLGEDIKKIDAGLAQLETALRDLELEFPNVPHAPVPGRPDETPNRVQRQWGGEPAAEFTPRAP